MIPIKLIRHNMVEWYFNKGYECNLRDEIWVRAKDLQHQSEKYIFVKCDYCGKIIERQFCIYIRGHKIIYKDCCDDCAKYKRDESMTKLYGTSNPMKVKDFVLKAKQTSLNRYGVEYYNQSNEGKERYKNTCQEKYGVDNISKSNYFAEKYKNTMNERYNVDNGFQSEEIKNKIKKTNMEKYGVPNPNQNEEIREKSKQTCIKKYGVDSPFQLEAFKEKIRHTNLKRYGFPYTMQSEEVREKSRETNFKKYGVYNPTQNKEILQKGLLKKYKKGNAPTSTQQRYLHKLLGGELNYVIEISNVDIAFPEEKIYIEYDGSGHNLSVILGDISEEQFRIKQIRRTYAITGSGWREIRIISTKDKLPFDNTILKMIKEAKEYLNAGHSWIHYNIDENKVKCSLYEKEYNYGELKKINNLNLEDN